jgi:hypothetical protein
MIKQETTPTLQDTTPEQSLAKPGSFWLVLDEGRFSLHIDGRALAEVNLPANVASFQGESGQIDRLLPVPHSEVIFDVVEQALGQEKINEFRTDSGRSEIDWRGKAAQQAEWFRQDCSPQMEPDYYTRSAWTLLNQQARSSELTPAADEARHNLSRVISNLDSNQGEWSEHALTSLDRARLALRERLREGPTPHELATHFYCEKASAVLSREGVRQRADSNTSAPDQASLLPATPDACWMELGFDRYRLVVDGQERATAYARLKTAAIPDPDTHRRETIVALDSETIFEAVEKRVGLPRVTAFTPEDRLQDRIELEKDASTFREMCAPRDEPQFYVWDAMNSLFAETAGRTGTDFETARDHLGKALEALKEGDDLAEAGKQVDHARQYLPSLTDSPSDFKPHIFNAIANCDRAAQAIERNASMERGGADLSHEQSTSPSRGRGRH